jgi:DNA-binding transcriptional regulator YdaS (Cro superfamily)
MTSPTPPTPERLALEKAIALIGGTMAAARAFGIKPPSISRWLSKGRAPSDRCLRLQQLTKGAVTVHELRPDVFGAAPGRKKRGTGDGS